MNRNEIKGNHDTTLSLGTLQVAFNVTLKKNLLCGALSKKRVP